MPQGPPQILPGPPTRRPDQIRWDDQEIRWDDQQPSTPTKAAAPPSLPFLAPALQFGMEVGGSVLGARAMAPVKAASALWNVGRAALGAGLGAGAGTAVSETLIRPQAGQPPPTLGEIGSRVGTSIAAGTVGEGVGAGMSAGISKGVSKFLPDLRGPMRSRISTEGALANDVLGGTAVPGQIADSRGLSLLDNLFGSTILGGGKFRGILAEQRAKLQQMVDDVLNKYRTPGQLPPTVEDAGKAIQAGAELAAAPVEAEAKAAFGVAGSAAEQATQARTRMIESVGGLRTTEVAGKAWQPLQEAAHTSAHDAASALYGQADVLAKPLGKTISLDPLIDVAKQQEATIPEMARLFQGKAGQLPTAVKRTGQEVIEGSDPAGQAALEEFYGAKVGERGEKAKALSQALQRANITPERLAARQIGFMDAHRIRSEFGKMIREADRSGNGAMKAAASEYFAAIDTLMDDAAQGDEALRATYGAARTAWKEMVRDFEDGILARVADKDPRLVMETFVKPGSVDDILLARKKVGEAAWSHIAGAHLNDFFKGKNGWATGKELQTKIHDLTYETIEAIYGKGGRARIDQYLKETLASSAMAEKGTALSGQAAKLRADIPEAYRAMSDAIRPGKVEDIEKLQTLIGPTHWKTVKAAKAEQIFTGKGGKPATGKEVMDNLYALKPETVRAMFGRVDADQLFLLGRVMQQVQRKQPGTLTWLIPTTQVSAALGLGSGLATGDIPSAKTAAYGTAVLLGPGMLARIALSPSGRKWLTTGLQARAAGDTGAATRAFTQLTIWGVKEGLIDPHLAATTPGPAQPTLSPAATSGRGAGPGPRGGTIPQPQGPPSLDEVVVPPSR